MRTDDDELNGLGEQPEVVITEEQPKKVVQRFKYKELYEEAKDLAQWRLVMLRAAGIIAALGWSAFIITILTK